MTCWFSIAVIFHPKIYGDREDGYFRSRQTGPTYVILLMHSLDPDSRGDRAQW